MALITPFYLIEIQPFPEGSNRDGITISNGNFDRQEAYVYKSLHFSNDIFDPSQTGDVEIVSKDNNNSLLNFFIAVNEGDVIIIQEYVNDFTYNVIFRGYITEIQWADSPSSGSVIRVNFANILFQLVRAKTVNTSEDQGLFSINSGVVNNAAFSLFLEQVFAGTIIVANTNSNVDINTPPVSIKVLKGQYEDSAIVLTPAAKIYAYYNAYMSKMETLQRAIFPYQRFIYQDSSGDILITPLALTDAPLPNSWIFSIQDSTGYSTNLIPYTSMTFSKRAASVFNRQLSALIALPANFSKLQYTTEDVSNIYASILPNANLFPRARELALSKFFTFTNYTLEDVLSSPEKNSTILANISTLLRSESLSTALGTILSNQYETPTASTAQSLAKVEAIDPIFIMFNNAMREMSMNLIDETEIIVTTPRISNQVKNSQTSLQDQEEGIFDIPLGQMVYFNFPAGVSDSDAYFCRGFSLTDSAESGAVLTLRLCKPLTGSAYWVQGALVDA